MKKQRNLNLATPVAAGLLLHALTSGLAIAQQTGSEFNFAKHEVTKEQRLSQWLTEQPAVSQQYALGAMWTTQEELERQTKQHKALLHSLDEQLAKGMISSLKHVALRKNLLAMQPTGRVPVAMVDANWLAAYPQKDPLLKPGDTFGVPMRPIGLRVMFEDGSVCEIPHREGLQAKDYVAAAT